MAPIRVSGGSEVYRNTETANRKTLVTHDPNDGKSCCQTRSDGVIRIQASVVVVQLSNQSRCNYVIWFFTSRWWLCYNDSSSFWVINQEASSTKTTGMRPVYVFSVRSQTRAFDPFIKENDIPCLRKLGSRGQHELAGQTLR